MDTTFFLTHLLDVIFNSVTQKNVSSDQSQQMLLSFYLLLNSRDNKSNFKILNDYMMMKLQIPGPHCSYGL